MTPDRAEYARGLRILADAIDSNETMPLPHYALGWSHGLIFTTSAEEFAAVAALVDYDSHDIDDRNPDPRMRFRMSGRIGGLRVEVVGDPAWACEPGMTRTVEQTVWTFRGQPVGAA